MQVYSFEKSMSVGQERLEELYQFIFDNSRNLQAYEMERAVFLKVMKIGHEAMRGYFGKKGTGDVGPVLELEDGRVFKRESELREKAYFSIFGKFNVPRTCYRLKGEGGIMPLDAEANLPKRCYSYALQEWMDILGVRDSFNESSITLERLLGLKVYSNRIEDVNRDSSMSYDQFYAARELPDSESEGAINVLGYDGAGVPVLKEEKADLKSRLGKGEKRQKKKEAMVGVSYTIDPKVRKAEDVARNLVYPQEKKDGSRSKSKDLKPKNIRRMASLERGREEVIREIAGYARQRDPENKRPWVVVMDGALNLWNIVATVLSGIAYVGILDIIHVTEYIWGVANALHGENTPKGRAFVYDNLLEILKGRVDGVVCEWEGILEGPKKLKKNQKEALEDAIRYFKNHRQWMRYDEYLKAGYPIGSGVVESTCGHTVKDRVEGTGKRWSVEGAEGTLLLRSVYTSNDWDSYWRFHMELERSFHYHRALAALGIPDDYDELGISERHHSDTQMAAAA